MRILSENIKGDLLTLTTNKDLSDISLDEQLELSRKYKATWVGGCRQYGKTFLLFRLYKQKGGCNTPRNYSNK